LTPYKKISNIFFLENYKFLEKIAISKCDL
jgi:hypothetical protein